MRVHGFETATALASPPEQVFPFFAEAGNLERITPPELRFRIVSPHPIQMREGALITYRLRLFGVSFEWLTRIAVWDPPHLFADEQLRGPYRRWYHTHRFEETPAGTVMHDSVEYALPLFPLGEIAAPLVAWQVGRIFRYRERVIRSVLQP